MARSHLVDVEVDLSDIDIDLLKDYLVANFDPLDIYGDAYMDAWAKEWAKDEGYVKPE